MRILYLSQYFPPEVGVTQTRAYEMARGLVRAGHRVTMIAEVPNHPSGIIPPEYRGKLYEPLRNEPESRGGRCAILIKSFSMPRIFTLTHRKKGQTRKLTQWGLDRELSKETVF